jgi:hypothetical protein
VWQILTEVSEDITASIIREVQHDATSQNIAVFTVYGRNNLKHRLLIYVVPSTHTKQLATPLFCLSCPQIQVLEM